MSLPSPSPAEMEQIAATPDPVVRNLRITHAYARLSAALTGWTGEAANWCTFATWASKQAGQTIRGEDLRRTVEHRLAVSPEIGDTLAGLVREARAAGIRLELGGLRQRLAQVLDPAALVARTRAAVSRGNTKVFSELGPLFARFIGVRAGEAGRQDERLSRFLTELRTGGPPDGQDQLREAFGAYAAASRATDPATRLQHVFLGNLLIGHHEQVRLQPEIREALDVSFGDRKVLRRRLVAACVPGFWMPLRQRVSAWLGQPLPLDRAADQVIERVQREVRRLVTELMMSLALPNGELLRLGRDVTGSFPAELNQLSLPRLIALLRELDPTPDHVGQSGATDWGDLAERMHYICDLFRCHALRRDLFDPPYTVGQVEAFNEGRRPGGPL